MIPYFPLMLVTRNIDPRNQPVELKGEKLPSYPNIAIIGIYCAFSRAVGHGPCRMEDNGLPAMTARRLYGPSAGTGDAIQHQKITSFFTKQVRLAQPATVQPQQVQEASAHDAHTDAGSEDEMEIVEDTVEWLSAAV